MPFLYPICDCCLGIKIIPLSRLSSISVCTGLVAECWCHPIVLEVVFCTRNGQWYHLYLLRFWIPFLLISCLPDRWGCPQKLSILSFVLEPLLVVSTLYLGCIPTVDLRKCRKGRLGNPICLGVPCDLHVMLEYDVILCIAFHMSN